GILDDATIVVSFAGRFILHSGQAEEQDGGDAERAKIIGLARDLVDGDSILPGHRRDLVTDALTVRNEERIDEVRGGESRFRDEAAQALGLAEAAVAREV